MVCKSQLGRVRLKAQGKSLLNQVLGEGGGVGPEKKGSSFPMKRNDRGKERM